MFYRDQPTKGLNTIGLAIPLIAWIAFVWFVVKPPVNGFFIEHIFDWMPVNFLDDYFLSNLDQYSPAALRVIGV